MLLVTCVTFKGRAGPEALSSFTSAGHTRLISTAELLWCFQTDYAGSAVGLNSQPPALSMLENIKLRGALVDCLTRLADFSPSCAPVLPKACRVPADAISDCCSSSAAYSRTEAYACQAAASCSQCSVSVMNGSVPCRTDNCKYLVLHALNQAVGPSHCARRIR